MAVLVPGLKPADPAWELYWVRAGGATVVPLRGESAHGYYYKATVRTPEKGGFGHVAQGEVKAANVTITFTILSNDGQEAAEPAATSGGEHRAGDGGDD